MYTKDGGGVNDLPYKPNLDLLVFWNTPRRCYVNKDGGGVNELSSKPNFELVIILKLLLLSRDVNSPRLCYVNNEVGSVTPCLT